jgi:hypothetical protein
VHVEGLRRTVRRSFAYGADGHVEGADLVITCAVEPLRTYINAMLASVGAEAPLPSDAEEPDVLRQSFRELDLNEALARL